ncbi:MAG: YabP/YqfC family sporulation protein [Ruminococcus sp.]|nr:YabP/YqfC family sporulation protein [Ruminococcus sp.]
MFRKLFLLAEDALYLRPQIHFDCGRELIIDNCRRIEEYNEVFMRLISGRHCIEIRGEGMRAFDYKTRGLVIRGRIDQVEFTERRGSRNEGSASGMREDKREGE